MTPPTRKTATEQTDAEAGTTAAPRAAANADVAQLSYEQAKEQLVGVVRSLEAGGQSLEESLALWERGEALADRCQSWLTGAKDTLAAAKARREAAEED